MAEFMVHIEPVLVWTGFSLLVFIFFQAEDGIRDIGVTGVQTCALPIFLDCSPSLGTSTPHATWRCTASITAARARESNASRSYGRPFSLARIGSSRSLGRDRKSVV